MAPRGVAATGMSGDLCWCAPPTAAGESGRGSARCGGGRHPLSVQARTLLRASPRRGRVRNGSALSGGGRRLPVRAYHHRGRVRKAPHGVAAAGYHVSRGWVFGGFGNGSGRKLSSNFEPGTRFSFLKASLKSLATTSHRHMAREKSLPSPGLHDDDYVMTSFTPWRHR